LKRQYNMGLRLRSERSTMSNRRTISKEKK
jgi:hypothetical protein